MPDAYEFDVFVSHASEDQDGLVRSLSEALSAAGLRVWYSEWELQVGDNLGRRIDEGLIRSKYGIVVLSPAFFAKPWTSRELDGLTSLEFADGRKRILPIWHGVTHSDVANYSPPLAAILALNSADSMELNVRRIVAAAVSSQANSVPPKYDRIHVDGVVDLVQLARESGGVIRNHYFKGCRLLGPAVMVIMGNPTFLDSDFAFESLWVLDTDRGYVGGIAVDNCHFESMRLDEVGIAGPAELINKIIYSSSMPGDPDYRDLVPHLG